MDLINRVCSGEWMGERKKALAAHADEGWLGTRRGYLE
jgi:hypothetical protein